MTSIFRGDSSSAKAGFGMTGTDGMAVVLFDVFGREVTRKEVVSEKTVFYLRGVENGVYFYHIEIKDKWYSGKVVVQR